MEKRNNIVFMIMACVLIVIFTISLCPVTLQNDTYYTIKIGEYITQNGISVLTDGMDPFSWHSNLPYTFPHWLYDFMIFNVFNIGGFLGIHLSTIIFASVLGLSMFFVNTKLTKNKLTSFIITLFVLFLMRGFIAARAQLITFTLFIWTIYFIEQYLKTKEKRYVVGLIIIPIIIANIHLAVWPFFFILFLPYIAEYIISLVKFKSSKIDIERNNNVKGLIIIAIICAFTGLLTPLGDTPYTYLLHTMQGNTMNYISEHLPLVLGNRMEVLIYITVIFAILMFTNTKLKLRELFMLGGLLFLAIKSGRQVSMFVLISSIILNRFISEIFNRYDPDGTKKMTDFMIKIPGIIITIGVVLIVSLYMIKPKLHNQFISPSAYPVEASEFIKENIDLSKMRLFNEYNYGSYLLYKDIPVFIDSRADLYAPEFNGGQDIFKDFMDISNLSVYYENKFKEYEITHVILYKNSKLNMFVCRDNNYKNLYTDDYFAIYERLTSNN